MLLMSSGTEGNRCSPPSHERGSWTDGPSGRESSRVSDTMQTWKTASSSHGWHCPPPCKRLRVHQRVSVVLSGSQRNLEHPEMELTPLWTNKLTVSILPAVSVPLQTLRRPETSERLSARIPPDQH